MFALLQAMSLLSLLAVSCARSTGSRPRGPAIVLLTLANICWSTATIGAGFFVGIEGLWALLMARRLLAR